MIKVNFIQHNGEKTTVNATQGETLMAAAIENEVPGIDADCGGACSCATCHVFIDDNWVIKVGKPQHDEEALLNLNPDRQDNSRLSCQIEISEELDGLTLKLPEFQF